MSSESESPDGQKQRRTNAERTAQTQHDLLEATIDCLNRLGYGATTTHVVAEAAGMSRGAMMHHYPTKADLMAAAVRYAWEKEFKAMQIEIEKVPAGLERFRAMIDVHWQIVQLPEDTAINEVRHGTRSDPELATAVQPVMAEISADYTKFVGAQIRQANLEPNDDLRGLALTWVFSLPRMAYYRAADPGSRMVQTVLASLKNLQEMLIQKQLGPKA
jgi:AcrR family transcriptional regulator